MWEGCASHTLSCFTHTRTHAYTHTYIVYTHSHAANNIWLKIRQDGEKPMSRDGHACTSIHGEMIIHGGFSASVSWSEYE